MKILEKITIVCVDCVNYGGAYSALKNTLKHIKPKRAILLTDIKMSVNGVEVLNIPKIKSKREYSLFIIKELYKYIQTDYVLIVQADGYVIDGNQWDDRFLNYDIIGAPWPYDHDRQVGNGGCSLRSRRLHEILGEDNFIDVVHPEDQSISIIYKFYLEEKYGIKFAPVELAEKFSFELKEPNQPTFAFHGNFHNKYKPSVLLSRAGACGDIVQMEPLIRKFHEMGCQVVLDIPIYFMELFDQQEYPVKHISQFDHGRIPYYYVNLDFAYEKKPNQLHLKSYFEECQITGDLVNPKLSLGFDPKADANKIFKKYVVVHNPIRNEPHRNILEFDWVQLAAIFWDMGYEMVQIGVEEKKEIIPAAIQMNTPSISLLKWVLSGADYFIGVDSGPANIAVALGIPSIIFSGSVDLRNIYADLSDICWVNSHEYNICPAENKYCWHHEISTNGKDCVISKEKPPCSIFDTNKTIDKIKTFIDEQTRKSETNNQHILAVSGKI